MVLPLVALSISLLQPEASMNIWKITAEFIR